MPLRLQLSLLLALAGVVICGAGVIQFRRLGTTMNPVQITGSTQLVTGGIYRFSRNPMYLGFLLLLTGWTLYISPLLVLLLPPLFVSYMNRFQITIEERTLLAQYGDGYRDYSNRVGRWI